MNATQTRIITLFRVWGWYIVSNYTPVWGRKCGDKVTFGDMKRRYVNCSMKTVV